jgi:hypothetical protein
MAGGSPEFAPAGKRSLGVQDYPLADPFKRDPVCEECALAGSEIGHYFLLLGRFGIYTLCRHKLNFLNALTLTLSRRERGL